MLFKKSNEFYIQTGLFCAVVIAAASVPLATTSVATLNLLMTINVMAVFSLSYNLLLGFTGIVSLGHALFFGTGAYAVGIIMRRVGPTTGSLLLAILIALLIAVAAGLITGFLSLRVKHIHYAMITLAFAELFLIVGEKWHSVTGGMDGVSFKVPQFFQSRVNTYYVVLVFTVAMILLLKRFISSPTGRVLVAIRENEERAQSLGFDVLRYKLISNVTAGVIASLAGVAFALINRFVRTGVLGLDRTIDALLMTIIGGVGALLGPLMGSVVIHLGREWLSDLRKVSPLFERWYIFFGLLFILIVLFAPNGIAGGIKKVAARFSFKKRIKTIQQVSSED